MYVQSYKACLLHVALNLPNVRGIETQSPSMSSSVLQESRFLKKQTDLCMSEALSLEVWWLRRVNSRQAAGMHYLKSRAECAMPSLSLTVTLCCKTITHMGELCFRGTDLSL